MGFYGKTHFASRCYQNCFRVSTRSIGFREVALSSFRNKMIARPRNVMSMKRRVVATGLGLITPLGNEKTCRCLPPDSIWTRADRSALRLVAVVHVQ